MEKIGIIGLGKIGGAVARRMYVQHGISIHGYDSSTQLTTLSHVIMHDSMQSLVQECSVILMFVPHSVVDTVVTELHEYVQEHHLIIDCGNSHYTDSVRRYHTIKRGKFADCGVSGGIRGEKEGFCAMFGCDESSVSRTRSVLQFFCQKQGIVYCGGIGSGHLVKTVHNGIEYAVLQAYAEGMQLLQHSEYDIDLAAVTSAWEHGSIMRSFINKLLHEVLSEPDQIERVSGVVGANGTGKWAAELSCQQETMSDLIRRSVAIREWSQQSGGDFSTKLVSLLRKKFGGHPIVPSDNETTSRSDR